VTAHQIAQSGGFLKGFAPVFLLFFALGLFGFLLSPVRAEEMGTGIVYGDDHAFAVRAPRGWVLDNRSGVPDGLQAVFYPTGSTWRDSRAVMYVNTTGKHAKGEGKSSGSTGALQAFVAADVRRFRQESPGVFVSDSPSLTTKDGKTALIRTFTGDKWKNREAVAYIDEPTIVAMIVLSSRDEGTFEKCFPAFEQLVASYEFITTKPNLEKLKELQFNWDFDARVEAAKQAELVEGAKEWVTSTGPVSQAALNYCLPPSAPPFRGNFTMVAEVLPSGTLSSVWVRPDSDVSRCFRERMKQEKLPPPPSSYGAKPYPITFTINVVP